MKEKYIWRKMSDIRSITELIEMASLEGYI